MSFEKSARFVGWIEILISDIDRVKARVGDPPDLARLEDETTNLAVERLLERVSEAVSRLHRAKVELDALEPEIPWSAIRGFGNFTRHEYDDVDPRMVAGVILDDLVPLRAAALRLKARFERQAS